MIFKRTHERVENRNIGEWIVVFGEVMNIQRLNQIIAQGLCLHSLSTAKEGEEWGGWAWDEFKTEHELGSKIHKPSKICCK